jgi:CRISPR-associated Csx3 family protein
MKIVVCGPPHSGKSVFLGGLCENLPRTERYLFRACPDGEGTWTYKGNGSEQYRRKGKFSCEVVDWYCQSLAKCEMAPIILVDIGGIPSGENQRILKEGGVTHAIILAGNLEKVPEWEQFLKDCGIEVIATLHSDYNGETDNTSSNPMVVHHLERGDEEVKNRPAIQVVAEKILTITTATTHKEGTMEFLKEDVLSIAGLAEALGKSLQERELPNGKVIKQLLWEGNDLIEIAKLLHNRINDLPKIVKIDGAAPAWLATGIVHECHPRMAALNSPDGYIEVEGHRARGNGEGPVGFSVRPHATEEGWTVVEFTLDPSVPLDPKCLGEVVPPELPMGAKVVISGRGPNWLVASIAMGYHGRTAAVACFQPGTGSTVCMTHTASIALGSIVPGNA